jgi:type II secretory pathway predicted ATPase ExeA/cell division septation protein DedD
MNPSSFGMARDPFGRDPAIDGSCLPEAHSAILQDLEAGLESGRGVSVVVADAAGDVALLAGVFAKRLASRTMCAHLDASRAGLFAMLDSLARSVGAHCDPEAPEAAQAEAIRAALVERESEGPPIAILIERADACPAKNLERIGRLLAGEPALETHLYLFGLPELLDRLSATGDRGLLPDLAQICRVPPLSPSQAVEYLSRRIEAVGARPTAVFSQAALHRIAREGSGRLSALEALAGSALAVAAKRGALLVGVECVETALTADVAEWEIDTTEGRLSSARTAADVDAGGAPAPERTPGIDSEDDVVELDDDFGDDDAAAPRTVAGRRPTRSGADAGAGDSRPWLVAGALAMAAAALVWAALLRPDATDVAQLRPAPAAPVDAATAMARYGSGPAPGQVSQVLPPPQAGTDVAGVHDAPAPVTAPPTEPPAPASVAASTSSPGTAMADQPSALAPPTPVQTPTGPASGGGGAETLRPEPPAGVAAGAASALAPPTSPATTPVAPVAAASPKASPPAPAATGAGQGSGGPYTVQLGAFGERANAERLLARVRRIDPAATIAVRGGLAHVLSGSFASAAAAEPHARALTAKGFATYVRRRP